MRLDRCSAAACETRERIAGDQLPQVEPGRELEYDGGQVDSGGDSDSGAMPELDAGPPQVDAGSDGGLPNDDAGVRSDGGPTTMPASCAEHLARAGMPLPDGVYVIDPDGAGAVEPIQVFCEMQDDGGGWTLLLKADGFDAPPGGASQLGFDSAYWTGSARLRPTSLSRDREEAVLDAYHSVGVRELRIEMWETPGRSASAVLGTLGGDSLGATIRAGVSVPLGDRATWEPVVGQSLPSAACLESGINVRMAGAVFVRVGAVASGNASCAPAVGWMGIGARVSAQSGCDASTNSAGGARLCGPPGQRRTWQRFALVFGR